VKHTHRTLLLALLALVATPQLLAQTRLLLAAIKRTQRSSRETIPLFFLKLRVRVLFFHI
jgi:hypothetical protein